MPTISVVICQLTEFWILNSKFEKVLSERIYLWNKFKILKLLNLFIG